MKLKGKGRLRFTVLAVLCAVNTAGFTSFAMSPEGETPVIYGATSLEDDLPDSASSKEVAKKVTEAVQQIAVEENRGTGETDSGRRRGQKESRGRKDCCRSSKKSAGGRSKTSGSADILRGWKSAL